MANLTDAAIQQFEKGRFVQGSLSSCTYFRTCEIMIAEDEAVTWIHPESFSLRDVYGQCELTQMLQLVEQGKEAIITPIVISKYEFAKNKRSFEEEAAKDVLSKSGTQVNNCLEEIPHTVVETRTEELDFF